MIRFSLPIIFLLFTVLPNFGQGIADAHLEITGSGITQSAAFSDATRQTAELFGGVEIISESEARNFVLNNDRIQTTSRFTGSKLDRFFQGFRHRDGLWHAHFIFPDEFVRAVQSRPRDTGASNLTIDWDVVSYQSRYADSFGEVGTTSYSLQIPDWYRELINDNVLKTDNLGPVAGTFAGLALVSAILSIAALAWRNSRKEPRFPR